MQQPIIVCINGVWGTFSWADGLRLFKKERSLEEEAQENPEAVISRLMLEERWDDAEYIMDRFM